MKCTGSLPFLPSFLPFLLTLPAVRLCPKKIFGLSDVVILSSGTTAVPLL